MAVISPVSVDGEYLALLLGIILLAVEVFVPGFVPGTSGIISIAASIITAAPSWKRANFVSANLSERLSWSCLVLRF